MFIMMMHKNQFKDRPNVGTRFSTNFKDSPLSR